MIPPHRSRHPAPRPSRLVGAGPLLAAVCLLLLTGCVHFGRWGSSRTVMENRITTLPARVISNFFVVETKFPDDKTYRFIIDTGSTATFVSPELAKRFGLGASGDAVRRKVRVRSANGGEIELPGVTLRQLNLGDARFKRVPALVFDFTDLSGHLGLPIDGIVGFPVFKDTILTLDYPGQRLEIASYPAGTPPVPVASPRVSTIAFNNEQGTPLIPIQMGNESFVVLIDSGSDGSLSLNPVGLHPQFAYGPRVGTLISSLHGDRRQQTGRLSRDVLIGSHTVKHPIVDLTDQLSSIGGELLRHFVLIFDQRKNQATFIRDTEGPVTMAPRRSTGLSFARSPSYWRILAVIPDTPAASLPVQAGDLCVRINGELVSQWDPVRYSALLKSADTITCTLLNGTRETDVEIPVFDLVP